MTSFRNTAGTLLAALAMTLGAGLEAAAQDQGVAAAFVDAPQNVFPLLDRTTRLDMLDYYRSNMPTPSNNNLDGKSRITALTPQTIAIAMTGSSDYQLAMLPSGNDSIIAVITTVKTPAPDSRLDLYSRSWEQLTTDSGFKKPGLREWLTDEGRKNMADVEAFVPFVLISYSYDPATGLLTLTNNTSQFLSPEINEMTADYLLPSLTYRWNGKKFRLAK